MDFTPNVNISLLEYERLKRIEEEVLNLLDTVFCDGYNVSCDEELLLNLLKNVLSERDYTDIKNLGLIIRGIESKVVS